MPHLLAIAAELRQEIWTLAVTSDGPVRPLASPSTSVTRALPQAALASRQVYEEMSTAFYTANEFHLEDVCVNCAFLTTEENGHCARCNRSLASLSEPEQWARSIGLSNLSLIRTISTRTGKEEDGNGLFAELKYDHRRGQITVTNAYTWCPPPNSQHPVRRVYAGLHIRDHDYEMNTALRKGVAPYDSQIWFTEAALLRLVQRVEQTPSLKPITLSCLRTLIAGIGSLATRPPILASWDEHMLDDIFLTRGQ